MTRHDDPGDSELVAEAWHRDSRGPELVLLPAREVPLGGVRAMSVRRSLPQRDLPTVGAWCFLDRFGPQDVRMRVEPHPHMGLQTVTWPLVGEVRHRDSIGSDVVLKRGALNLMTSGHGISHSEYSVGDEPIPMDALQLWIALPERTRHGASEFETHADLPLIDLDADVGGANAIVVMGTLADVTSPATTHTPLVGAELSLEPATGVSVPLNPDWEYAIVGLHGEVTVAGKPGPASGDLLYLGMGRDHVTLTSTGSGAVFLLGGEPFEDDLVMWWNFVGRDHDEIVTAWHDWQGLSSRFGRVDGHGDTRIPAPPLPTVRLLPRKRQV